jgi:hypothetical protein
LDSRLRFSSRQIVDLARPSDLAMAPIEWPAALKTAISALSSLERCEYDGMATLPQVSITNPISRRVGGVALHAGTQAGALITPLSSVDPNMGFPWLVSAFMIVLLSGASLVSLAASALVLGGAQVLVSTFVNPVAGGMTIAVLAAVILRIRPFARG